MVEVTLRVTRKVYAMLLAAMIACVLVIEWLLHPVAIPLSYAFYESIATVAVLCAGAAVVVRYRMLRPAFDVLRANPDDAASHKRWRAGTMVSYMLTLCVFFFGCRLRMMGATFTQATPLYAGGLVLMLLWWPRRP